MAARCMSRKTSQIVLWISVPILVVSVAVLMIFPTIYKKQLKNDVTLTDGSLITNIWRDIPLPIYEKLYFFNITNGDDFLKHGAPLNVTEHGPYTYSSRWVKNDPVWHSNGTVSYREIRTYQFEQSMSVGGENDSFNTLNGPMIIAANMLKEYNVFYRVVASIMLKLESETIITQKTVKELAYDGYDDIIIKLAPIVKKDIPYKDGRFSWLYGKNASDDGQFTVFTGEDDPAQTNMINNWNGQEMLNFWKGDSCNMINGTSVETGPPLPEDPEPYTFFQSIFCRSLTFNYTGDEDHYGIPTRRFKPNDDIFANGTDNPANSCFDLDEGRASGVLNVKPCQFGAPVFISFPHFYMADPSYRHNIFGLDPNAEEHGSHLDVEPRTGISLDIKIQFQVNVEMSRVKGVFQFSDVPEGIFPVFWVGLEIHVNDNWASFFKSSLNNPKIIAYSVLGILAIVSLVLVICALVFLRLSYKDEEDDPLIDVKEEHKANLGKKTIVPDYDPSKSQRQEKSGGVSNKGLDLSSEISNPGAEVTTSHSDPSISEKS